MEVKDAIKQRRSVPHFDPEKEVTDAQLRELFEQVKLAPSAWNLQPWDFVVVRDPVTKQKLREAAYGQEHVTEASAVMVVLGNPEAAKEWGEKVFLDSAKAKGQDVAQAQKNQEIAINAHEGPQAGRDFAIRNTALAAMTLMLAAKGMGLDTHPMIGFKKDEVKNIIGAPKNRVAVMIILLGYQKGEMYARLPRRGFEEIVHLEKF